jgi:hypothetical protein
VSATPEPAGDDRVHARAENARIQGLREIVATGQWAKIDGEPVGPYSASHVVALHDRLTSPTREAYARLKVGDMIQLAFTKVVHKPDRGARRR